MNEDEIKTQEDLDKAWQNYKIQMISMGFSEDQLNQWMCVRFHNSHPWALLCLTVDGHKCVAFGRPADDEGKRIKIEFVATHSGMKIVDILGNEAQELTIPNCPDKRTIN